MNFMQRLTALMLAAVIMLSALPTAFVSAAPEDQSSGTFQCSWFNETLTYPYEYDDSYMQADMYEYSHDLAKYLLCASMASFNSFDRENGDEHLRALFDECGYETTSYGYETEGYDTVGISVGRKVIDGITVLLCIIRSGNYGMEWGGNLRVGSGTGNHVGYEISKETALLYLNNYFEENPVNGEAEIIISGYSRGASIANLMAAALDDNSYKDVLDDETDFIGKTDFQLTAYTFEAPQCTPSESATDKIYSNIFNIVNPNDYVPMFVMDEWGFTHYGVRVEMPSADNCDNYDEYYERVCREFDSFMGENGRKAKDCFYDEKHSKSIETTLDYIFAGLASDVMIDREYYHKNYEDVMVFFTGQYLGKKRTAKDFVRSVGFTAAATAICIMPKNLEKIKSDGYRKYLAEYIAENNYGELDSEQIENTINLLISILEYLSKIRKDVVSLLSQINTVVQVHQPYVALSWMRTLTDEDVYEINNNFGSVLRLSCNSINLKYGIDGKLVARFDKNLGSVEWSSSDEKIVSVSQDGVIKGNGKGTAVVTATLYSEDGEIIEIAQANVTIEMNVIQVFANFINGITSGNTIS